MLGKLKRAVRYRLGLPVVAPQLDEGTDASVAEYYNSRLSDCSFLVDTEHYERPRIDWMLDTIRAGRLLEIGCADGGMTALLAPRVDGILALDVCSASIQALKARRLPGVRSQVGLVETFDTLERFDWILMSEFLEHVRSPATLIERALQWLAPGGRILASSPLGQWEHDSIEHLQTFDLASWAALFTLPGVRSVRVFALQDRDGRDRWLGADVARD